jgi:hypothetical protein
MSSTLSRRVGVQEVGSLNSAFSTKGECKRLILVKKVAYYCILLSVVSLLLIPLEWEVWRSNVAARKWKLHVNWRGGRKKGAAKRDRMQSMSSRTTGNLRS